MTTERDPGTRIVLSWLREDMHENAERVLVRALNEVDTTQQRRSLWPARRFAQMNKLVLAAGAAAAVLLVAIVGYNLLTRSGGVGTQPTVAPSPSSSPSPSPTPTAAPITGPIVATWATGDMTCAQQLAAIEAAGFSAEQMTSVGVDLTCANGIAVEGAGWAIGSQVTARFFPDGRLVVSDNLDDVPDQKFTYRLIGATTFKATDALAFCLTYGYAIAGDQLTIEIVDMGCPAVSGEAPLLDQIALTVLFGTSPFTRQP